MPIDDKTPVFPGDPKQVIEQFATIEKEGWTEKRITFNSHFSTHIDAPIHMIKDGKTLSDFPIESFIGDAIVIDASNNLVPSLMNVKERDIVFFYTGYSEKAYTDAYFKDAPVMTKETAHDLVKRKVKIIGVDSLSPDNEPFEIHKILLGNNILIVENLVNLKELVGKRFQCFILPLKIQNGDGSPCRIIGILD